MKSSRKAIYAALAGNTLIAVTKFTAAAVTGSSAMLSEGIHSLVDTGNQVLLLHGLRRGARPADDDFPFGYGKEIYFWSFVVAILIFALGAGISIYEGIVHLRHPRLIENAAVNYVVLGLAMIFEGYSFLVALREFSRAKGNEGYLEAVHRGKDPSLFVVLFEDSAALLGLAVAFLGVYLGVRTGAPWFDGGASIVIGLILAGTAVWLARETKGLLIGERARGPVVRGIRSIAGAPAEVLHVNEVLTMHVGPEYVLANLSVDFADDVSAGRVEEVVAAVTARIKEAFPEVKRVFMEAEKRPPPGRAGKAGPP